MATSRGGRYWHLGLASFVAISGAIAFSFDCAHTQITPDGTLGAESSVVTPNSGGVDIISGGATRGTNLFHSFEQFSVLTGRTAFFNNAASIQNIISRVTGGSISNIDGLLRANGTANLFLINPNGISFSPNASLNIGGSFVGSTAGAVNFADGVFSATNPQATPLLSVNVPIGLQYESNAGSIQAQRSILQVVPGKTLALVGGNVSLDSGTVLAPGSLIDLGGLAGAGTVELSVDGSLSYPLRVQRADVSLSNGAYVDVSAGGENSIAVNARNLDITSESFLYAGTRKSLGSVDGRAGDITLNTTGALTLRQRSVIANVDAAGTGNGGNISISSPFTFVSEDSDITANSATGRGGSIQITTIIFNTFDLLPFALPAELADASNQIAASCSAGGESKFIITGRGGLPANPGEVLSTDAVAVDMITLNPEIDNRSSAAPATNFTSPAPTQIVEATGWMVNDKGDVVLTATAPAANKDIPWLPESGCHASQPSS